MLRKKIEQLLPKIGDLVVDENKREGLVINIITVDNPPYETTYDILWLDSMKNELTKRDNFGIFKLERG